MKPAAHTRLRACGLLLVVLLFLLPVAACSAWQSQPISPADWVGGITHTNGSVESIIVHFGETGGTLTIQPQSASLEIRDVWHDESTLSFKTIGITELEFSGRFEGERLAGNVKGKQPTSGFALQPLPVVSDEALAGFAGSYRLDAGETLLVNVSPAYSASGLEFFWHGLSLTHFGTGAIRGLYPAVAKDTFQVGRGRVLGYPFTAQITFTRDAQGQVSGLDWQAGEAGSAQHATRLAFKTETVHYTSADGITLTGLLTLPATPGPHPAIVVLHGSEQGRRDDFGRQQMSSFLAGQGIAVLTYDKRGVGDSGGTYMERATEENLALLAQDALAGVGYLKARPEIDAKHIGLIGASQAGWIIPLAARQSADVAFFVILSGPVVSVGTEDDYSALTNNGDSPSQYSPEEISAQLALNKPCGFDPLPVLTALEQPGLWLWGGHDRSVPVPESRKNLEALIAQGKSNFSYQFFPDADHTLQISKNGLFNEIPSSPGYPPDFHIALAEWLKAHVK